MTQLDTSKNYVKRPSQIVKMSTILKMVNPKNQPKYDSIRQLKLKDDLENEKSTQRVISKSQIKK